MADFHTNIPDFRNLSVHGYEHLRGAPMDAKRVVRPRALQRAQAEAPPVIETGHLPKDHEALPAASDFVAATEQTSILPRPMSSVDSPMIEPEPMQTRSDVGISNAARLDELWYQCWRAIGARGDGQASFEQLLAAHHDPARRVHGIEYLLDCFATLKRWRAHAEQFDALSLAVWYHDAYMDPQRHDNEARSARLAAEHLTGSDVPPETVRLIRDLIISTRPGEKVFSADSRLLNDIDRAPLAESPERYDRYERNLRYENSHIGDFIYRRKRIEFLQSTLSKTQLFATDFAHAEFDAAARENLRRWLQIWQQSAKPIPPENEPQSMLSHTI